jgi:hypothetical protein
MIARTHVLRKRYTLKNATNSVLSRATEGAAADATRTTTSPSYSNNHHHIYAVAPTPILLAPMTGRHPIASCARLFSTTTTELEFNNENNDHAVRVQQIQRIQAFQLALQMCRDHPTSLQTHDMVELVVRQATSNTLLTAEQCGILFRSLQQTMVHGNYEPTQTALEQVFHYFCHENNPVQATIWYSSLETLYQVNASHREALMHAWTGHADAHVHMRRLLESCTNAYQYYHDSSQQQHAHSTQHHEQHLQYQPTETMYALYLASLAHNVSDARAVVDTLQQAASRTGLYPTTRIYDALLSVCFDNHTDHTDNDHTDNTDNGTATTDIANQVFDAQLESFMDGTNPYCMPDTNSFVRLMRHNQHDPARVVQLWDVRDHLYQSCPVPSLKLNRDLCVAVLTSLAAAKETTTDDSLERATSILNDMIHAATTNYDVFMEPTPAALASYMMIWSKRTNDSRVVAVVERLRAEMEKKQARGVPGFKLDATCYSALIGAWANSDEPHAAQKAHEYLQLREQQCNENDSNKNKNNALVPTSNIIEDYQLCIAAWTKSSAKVKDARIQNLVTKLRSLQPKTHEEERDAVVRQCCNYLNWIANMARKPKIMRQIEHNQEREQNEREQEFPDDASTSGRIMDAAFDFDKVLPERMKYTAEANLDGGNNTDKLPRKTKQMRRMNYKRKRKQSQPILQKQDDVTISRRVIDTVFDFDDKELTEPMQYTPEANFDGDEEEVEQRIETRQAHIVNDQPLLNMADADPNDMRQVEMTLDDAISVSESDNVKVLPDLMQNTLEANLGGGDDDKNNDPQRIGTSQTRTVDNQLLLNTNKTQAEALLLLPVPAYANTRRRILDAALDDAEVLLSEPVQQQETNLDGDDEQQFMTRQTQTTVDDQPLLNTDNTHADAILLLPMQADANVSQRILDAAFDDAEVLLSEPVQQQEANLDDDDDEQQFMTGQLPTTVDDQPLLNAADAYSEHNANDKPRLKMTLDDSIPVPDSEYDVSSQNQV